MEVSLEKSNINIRNVFVIISISTTLVISFYSAVVIPIRDIQLKLVSIEVTLADEKAVYAENNAFHKTVDERLRKLESK
jgi:uncharacterized surface anchored protein